MLLAPLAAYAQVERVASTPQELSSAIASSGPGDTIIMANGTWTDVVISFYAQGAEGDSITLRAETPGQVILNGSSRLRVGGSYLKVDGLWFDQGALASGHLIEFRRSSSRLTTHSRLTNCTITNYNPPSYLTEYKWVSIYGAHNRVDHCHFAGKSHDGATVVVWLRDPPNDNPVWHRIDNNYFGHRPELGKNGGETIRIGTSSRSMQDAYVTVEHNLFEECDGEIEIISNKSGNNIFRHNTFLRSSGTLTLRHGNEASVYGNYFLGEGKSGSGGVRIIGERHKVYNNYFQDLRGTGYRSALAVVNGVPNSPLNRYFQVKDAVVAFNTFVDVEETFVIGAGKSSEQSLAPDGLQIANNLVVTRNGPIVEYEDAPLNITYASNVFFGAESGIGQVDGILITDPSLIRDQDVWRLSSTSVAVGAATAIDFVTHDIDGQERDGLPDIGADEISLSPVVYRPLTSQDVGPSYLSLVLHSDQPALPISTPVIQVYPNPFRSAVTIDFELKTPGFVQLSIYDLLGREVAKLAASTRNTGNHLTTFDGSGLVPGIYFIVIEVDGLRTKHTLIRH
ncbi:MAG: T9SS type A sorting domain-containing protein [Rhodothermaceae bacterium]|nr:T9SS type A sorting domain-containing protein [Rhodothermaceae bacterium]MYD57292.1 T9SS type A sorting domain-containing protein [Rhodothermaceae bacterium]MYJ55121.1 T9SS type A sorting domain-containing protein [Rhodothermaceae bacterium]